MLLISVVVLYFSIYRDSALSVPTVHAVSAIMKIKKIHLMISSAIFIIYVGCSEEEGGKGDSSGVQVQLLLGCYRVAMN